MGQVTQTLRQGIWSVRISIPGTRHIQRFRFQGHLEASSQIAPVSLQRGSLQLLMIYK